VEDLARTLARMGSGVQLEARAAGPLPGAIDDHLARRAVSNLIVNALRHARSRVAVRAVPAAGSVQIDVDDDGPGVPAEERRTVFQPFRRSEGAAPGTGFGLGLAIVSRIAEAHGGTVTVMDSDLGGARFRFTIPAGLPEDAPQSTANA
jgi:signal transduction histidine kinase